MAATTLTGSRAVLARRPWTFVHYFALLGAVFLGVELWVWGAWLAGDPFSVTKYRTVGSLNWWSARFFEVLFLLLFLYFLVYVVRDCRRQGTFTFDAKLFVSAFTLIWLDPWTNFFGPIWMYSSNFLNFNNPLSGFPLAVNPDIGRLPTPAYFVFVYPVSNLGAALTVCAVMRGLRTRYPQMSNARLLLIVALCGMAFEVAYELPLFRLGLNVFPGTPDALALFPGDYRKFPIWEIVPAGIAFATFGALRFFKNDRGQSIVERGLDGLTAWRRHAVSLLALIGLLNLVWLAATSVQCVVGLYAAPYKPLPLYLINDMCDADVLGGGKLVGTRYGPCPEAGRARPMVFLPGKAPGSIYGSGPYSTDIDFHPRVEHAPASGNSPGR